MRLQIKKQNKYQSIKVKKSGVAIAATASLHCHLYRNLIYKHTKHIVMQHKELVDLLFSNDFKKRTFKNETYLHILLVTLNLANFFYT